MTELRLPFRVAEPEYDEPELSLPPAPLVEAHALAKARSVATTPADGPVIGVDTAVVPAHGRVLGKPVDTAGAAAMLATLAGTTHVVISGLAVVAGDAVEVGHAATAVTFRPLGDDEVDAYVATGEWRGRAGGYAIQGVGAALVERVEGCYPNVVGLPIALLVRFLGQLGYPVLPPGASR
jgi:septum formation protein